MTGFVGCGVCIDIPVIDHTHKNNKKQFSLLEASYRERYDWSVLDIITKKVLFLLH